MSDLIIDGNRLMMSLADWWYSSFGQEETEEAKAIRTVMDKVEESLDAFKIADVQPVVHGEWIDMGDFEQCSVCTGTHLKEVETVYGKAIWIKTNWCPNCGADMRGEQDE